MSARARQGCTGCWKATPLSRHRGRAEIRITDADGRPRRPAGRARAAHARSVAHRICFPKYTSRAYGNAGLRTTTTARTAGRPVKWRATDSRRDIARRAALDVRGRHDARLLRDPARPPRYGLPTSQRPLCDLALNGLYSAPRGGAWRAVGENGSCLCEIRRAPHGVVWSPLVAWRVLFFLR